MEFTRDYTARTQDIIAMFSDTFTQSEGQAAGDQIRGLVSDMLTTLPPADLYVFSAVESDAVLGGIIFTPLRFAQDPRRVFILAPVAVATDHQRKGIGQRLIAHGLEVLRDDGVEVALTYGDPGYYAKTGFAQITEDIAEPPYPLQYPHGWLGQSLTAAELEPLKGRSTCVLPLQDPAHW